jgi:hypothetical protein
VIVIGSYAAMLGGAAIRERIDNVDIVGSAEELDQFRASHAADILRDDPVDDHHVELTMRPGLPVERARFGTEQSASDLALADLAQGRAKLMGSEIAYPSLAVLYLIKRAHANNPVGFEKTVADMLLLKPHAATVSPAEMEFYKSRKKESKDRFAGSRQRFVLSISNEDFFALSNHVRTYVHDDVHAAIAHEQGRPVYLRCKRDATKAKIDTDLFEAMSLEDRLRMVQEEFIVIGIERNYVNNRQLSREEVYTRGMMKTVKDLFLGYFQDFCLDNFDALQSPPSFDFLKRFDDGVASGEIHILQKSVGPPSPRHKKLWDMVREGKLEEARVAAEDMARRADPPGDPHALHVLGQLYERSGQPDLSERCLRESLGIFGQNARALAQLGNLLCQKGEFAAALTFLSRAVELNPNSLDAQMGYGIASEQTGNLEGARKAYEASLRLKPGLSAARQRLTNLGGTATTPSGWTQSAPLEP